MRPHELLAFALLCAAAAAQADPSSDYGKVDTFQPGKKYNCLPTADRKGWNCTVTGNADAPPPAEPAQTRPAPPVQTPAREAIPAAPPAEPAPRASALPGYLTNSGANQSMQPMPAAAAPKPAPQPRVKGPMVPAQTPAPAKPAPKPAQPAPTQAPVESTPRPAPAAPAPVPAPAPPTQDFLALPATSYVIELAHADSKPGLDAARAAAPTAHGEVYELHLQQNGIDTWLLLWGPFENLDAARAARAELVAQGATPGWPRRIGPLQSEMRGAHP